MVPRVIDIFAKTFLVREGEPSLRLICEEIENFLALKRNYVLPEPWKKTTRNPMLEFK